MSSPMYLLLKENLNYHGFKTETGQRPLYRQKSKHTQLCLRSLSPVPLAVTLFLQSTCHSAPLTVRLVFEFLRSF